jgi:hypothetical protein
MSGRKGPLRMGHSRPAQYPLLSHPPSTFFVQANVSRAPALSVPRPSLVMPGSKSLQAIVGSA